MYSVYADGTCIYNDMYVDEAHRLTNPKLKLEDNSAGAFTAVIPPTNAGYEICKRISTEIVVKRDGDDIWAGRIISEKKDFWNQRSITCEGELAYLNDTIQPPAEYHDMTVRGFLETLINIHNAKVDTVRQFQIGVVTVTDDDLNGEDSIYRYTNYETTMKCISEKLIKRLNGHIRVRRENGISYIDYLKDYPKTNSQVLRFGKNLIDFTKNWDLSKLATVVVPRGKSLDESPIEALTAYLTVKDVNNGSIYVSSDDAVKEFGWIEVVVDWDDVTDANNLLRKAKLYLENYQFDKMTIELKALDMHYLSKNEGSIDLLDEIRCVSNPHGMDRYFPVTAIELYLDQPDKTTYTLGDSEIRSMTSSTNSANSSVLKKIENLPPKQVILKEAKDNATKMIHTATHGYVVMNYDENGTFEILIMDTDDIKTAKKVWRWNLAGLGYSNNGYNGDYGLAMTMDGSIVADFITTGTMYADRIKGGTLTLGGADNKSGVANIKDRNGKVLIKMDNTGITLDSSVKISWGNIAGADNVASKGDIPTKTSQLTNDSNLAYKSEIPTDAYMTQITKNTVTTAYINALNVKAGSVAAENITGTTISGKNISGCNFYQRNGNTFLNIVGGEMHGGMNGVDTGYISFASTIDGQPSLDFRASKLNFCMDTVYVGHGKDTTSVTKAYTGDIKYCYLVKPESNGGWSAHYAVMQFRNGLLLDNG